MCLLQMVANRRRGNYANWMNICLPDRLLDRHRWLVFLLPFVVFMLVGSLEPTSPSEPGGKAIGLAIPYADYPWVYTAKIILTVAAIVAVLPGCRQFSLRLGGLAVGVGIVGGPLWIGLCWIDFHYVHPALQSIGLGWFVGSGARPGFNPLVQLAAHPAGAWGFLAVRFIGLAAVVPVIEEFFLRGFVMRLVGRSRLVERAVRQSKRAGARRRHRAADAQPSGRTVGGRRVVLDDYLAHASHPEHLGLRPGPRPDEPDPRHLRSLGRRGRLAADVAVVRSGNQQPPRRVLLLALGGTP